MAFSAQAQETINICDRTQQVQDEILRHTSTDGDTCDSVSVSEMAAITVFSLNRKGSDSFKSEDLDGLTGVTHLNLASNRLSGLPPGIFSDVMSVRWLSISSNHITNLSSDIFSGLSKLVQLHINHNRLRSLPDGIFSGLAKLTHLSLQGNSVSFRFTVRFEPENLEENFTTASVRVVLREGAPRTVTVPLSVIGGTLSANSLRIAKGGTQSDAVTVTRDAGGGAFSLSQGRLRLSGSDVNYRGFEIVSGEAFEIGWDVCDRTPQVRDEILRLISVADIACDNVFLSELAAVTNLDLRNKGIGSLKPGDFDGFTGLTSLNLTGNNLNRLPIGIFAGLTSLDTLNLRENRGADFRLTVRFSSSGLRKNFTTASVRVVLREGAPRTVTVPLSVIGGTLSANSLSIATGNVRSNAVTVTRTSPDAAFELSQGELGFGGDHVNYSGFEIVPGPAVTTTSFTHVRARVFLEGALE